jgi:enamine deaminase RidA (YjgF/YER057c/UK114 family)
MTMTKRLNITSGTQWEETVGYSRAVRIGRVVEVAGTTAVDHAGQVIGLGDPYAQTAFILTKIKAALREAGASLADVIRTRIYVTDIAQWEEIGRAHGDCLRTVKPASTMVQVHSLIRPELLVEIEVTAIVSDD